MKRHGNLWPRIAEWENLVKAYRKARKGKSRMKNVQKFELDIEGNLRRIHKSLLDKTYRTSGYNTKFVHEPKFRTVYTLPFNPDRIVQHAMMNVVEPIWDKLLIEYSYSCRTGKGVSAGHKRAVKLIRTNRYCLKCDISKFYPSINQDIMFEIVQHKIKCPDTLWLLDDIIHSFPGETNVPIGNYTSQWFANLYMDAVDQWAVHELKVDYMRYCDDFCFMSNDKGVLNAIKAELPQFLWEERRLTLSKLDLFPTARGMDFLGYRFFPNGTILLRKRVAKTIKRRMAKIVYRIHCGDDPEQYRSSVASALGILKQCHSYNLRQAIKLRWLVNKVGINTNFKI